MRRTTPWPFVLVGVLVVAIVILGVLQVRWITEVSDAHERRTRAELEGAAHRVNEDLMRELMHVASAFELREVNAAELARRYERWTATARDPRILGAIYVASPDGTLRRFDGRALVPAPWPESFRSLSAMPRTLFDPEIPAVILPVRTEGGHGLLVAELNAKELLQVFAPDLARPQLRGFDFAVVRRNEVVYRSDPSWPVGNGTEDADLVRPLIPGREERNTFGASVLFAVRHHGQPLTAIFAAVRRRDLTVALLILVLLGASLVILAITARRAERLRRQQLEFVAGVTHELHTPLAALASAGQNLADGIDVDTAKYGETIMKEARRLGDLVDDVLQFASMESRSASARSESIDVREAIGDAVAQCRWLADEQHVRVESVTPESLPRARGDRGAVTRAVQNLVANAIRHGKDGGWVGIRASAENGDVLITVQDRGPGIDAADLPHLFEPFYRGRNAQARGSGLGLTIVHGVARAHDGSVHAANRLEGGAEFTLRLPVQ